jgi:hypothetical protein
MFNFAAIDEIASNMEIERLARARYSVEEPDAMLRRSRYERYHSMYAPQGGDQWPEDRLERFGKLHISANMVRAFVDIEARLLSILPRVTNKPDQDDEEIRVKSETAEKAFLRWLEMSGWEVWMFTLNQTRGIYGTGVLKPFWNDETNAPDVYLVEQPQNLLIGWGDSDYSVMDWAIYESYLSPIQAKIKYPNAPEHCFKTTSNPNTLLAGGAHDDPLNQSKIGSAQEKTPGYDSNQIRAWDYWYLRDDGTVMNATLLNGYIVDGPHEHPEYPIVPYIPVESDHEPGYPWGRGTVEMLYDIQMGYNRALSHLAQLVWDETDPAFQLVGENAPMHVPDGIVPKGGEIVAPGPGTRIEPIAKNLNQMPLGDLIRFYWESAHKLTGIPEVLFGTLPGSQTSGRAVSVQLEAAINRLDPRRRRLYGALRQLFLFWHFMIDKKNPKVGNVPIKDVLAGLNRWVIIPPEITPRDVVEHTMNTINKLNAKAISLETAMDEIGVENPLEEIERVKAERSDAHLFPGDAQAIAAVLATLQQIQATQAQMTGAGQAQEAAAEGQGAQEGAQQDAQQAQPTGMEDMNNPMLQPGMAPPPGGAAPGLGGELQPIVRQTPGGDSQAMSQIVMPRRAI